MTLCYYVLLVVLYIVIGTVIHTIVDYCFDLRGDFAVLFDMACVFWPIGIPLILTYLVICFITRFTRKCVMFLIDKLTRV